MKELLNTHNTQHTHPTQTLHTQHIHTQNTHTTHTHTKKYTYTTHTQHRHTQNRHVHTHMQCRDLTASLSASGAVHLTGSFVPSCFAAKLDLAKPKSETCSEHTMTSGASWESQVLVTLATFSSEMSTFLAARSLHINENMQ